MSAQSAENDAAVVILRSQVERLENANRRAGYAVPETALIYLPYPDARALLDLIDRVIPPVVPAPGAVTGRCASCGVFTYARAAHDCRVIPPASTADGDR